MQMGKFTDSGVLSESQICDFGAGMVRWGIAKQSTA